MKLFSERKHFIVTTQPVKDLNPTILRISDYHYYRSQRSWGKVMFLQVSVILFTGWGWYPSMHCRSPGPCPGGKLRGLAWGGPGPHPGGSPGPHPEGSPGPHLGDLQAHTWDGASRLTPRGWVGIPAFTEADTPQQMATAPGGTHPTGMHSCFLIWPQRTNHFPLIIDHHREIEMILQTFIHKGYAVLTPGTDT